MNKESRKAVQERKLWLMNRKEVLRTLGISSATLHRGMLAGKIPRAYAMGFAENGGRVCWKSEEIFNYIDNLAHSEPMPVAPGCQGRKAKEATTDVI